MHFGPLGDWVEGLAALEFRAARLPSAVALRRCSAKKAPLLIRLRHDGYFKVRSSQTSTGVSKVLKGSLEDVFEAELGSSNFALSFTQFAVQGHAGDALVIRAQDMSISAGLCRL